jgi:hypothetical protein
VYRSAAFACNENLRTFTVRTFYGKNYVRKSIDTCAFTMMKSKTSDGQGMKLSNCQLLKEDFLTDLLI